METNFTGIEAQLSAIKRQLGSLYAEGAEQELKTCLAYCNQLLLDGSALTAGGGSDEVADGAAYGDKRGTIARMRTAVHTLQQNLEQVKTITAEAYRKQLGSAEKEAFERLSPELQQQYNAEAYRPFAAFHQADRLLDELSRLNTALMDAGHGLEQTHRQAEAAAQGATSAGGDGDELGKEAGGAGAGAISGPDAADVHRYDADPVPPSLSP
jgi:hypothetical protein